MTASTLITTVRVASLGIGLLIGWAITGHLLPSAAHPPTNPPASPRALSELQTWLDHGQLERAWSSYRRGDWAGPERSQARAMLAHHHAALEVWLRDEAERAYAEGDADRLIWAVQQLLWLSPRAEIDVGDTQPTSAPAPSARRTASAPPGGRADPPRPPATASEAEGTRGAEAAEPGPRCKEYDRLLLAAISAQRADPTRARRLLTECTQRAPSTCAAAAQCQRHLTLSGASTP